MLNTDLELVFRTSKKLKMVGQNDAPPKAQKRLMRAQGYRGEEQIIHKRKVKRKDVAFGKRGKTERHNYSEL